MALFWAMLPFYLIGNLHCIGMCGPLVMMIGRHRFRACYYAGRFAAFAAAGLFSGWAGSVLTLLLRAYQIPAAASFLFGGMMILTSVGVLFSIPRPIQGWFNRKLGGVSRTLSTLILQDKPFALFLFGFFTILLPCGQTLVVWSACAISGDPWIGFLNGGAFALLTIPSLFLAMHTHSLLYRFRSYYPLLIGITTLAVGVFALCRGIAELGWIEHWILNPEALSQYHIVLY